MKKAIIFDLNGVFIKSEKLSDRFQEIYGVSTEKFLPVLKKVLGKARLPGAGDSFTYWEPYLNEWGVNLNRGQFFEFWFSGEHEVSDMVSLARSMKELGVRLFILSNNFIERSEYYNTHFSFVRELPEKVYYSWQTGLVKPSVEVLKKILDENSLNPEDVVYFDDMQENIEVARSVGIDAHLFEGVSSVSHILYNN